MLLASTLSTNLILPRSSIQAPDFQKFANMIERAAIRDAESNVESMYTVHLQECEGNEHKTSQTIPSTYKEFNLFRYTGDNFLVSRITRKEERNLVVNLRVIAAASDTGGNDFDSLSSSITTSHAGLSILPRERRLLLR